MNWTICLPLRIPWHQFLAFASSDWLEHGVVIILIALVFFGWLKLYGSLNRANQLHSEYVELHRESLAFEGPRIFFPVSECEPELLAAAEKIKSELGLPLDVQTVADELRGWLGHNGCVARVSFSVKDSSLLRPSRVLLAPGVTASFPELPIFQVIDLSDIQGKSSLALEDFKTRHLLSVVNRAELMKYLRPATTDDYYAADLQRGCYRLQQDIRDGETFAVADKRIKFLPVYGRHSFTLFVPPGLTIPGPRGDIRVIQQFKVV